MVGQDGSGRGVSAYLGGFERDDPAAVGIGGRCGALAAVHPEHAADEGSDGRRWGGVIVRLVALRGRRAVFGPVGVLAVFLARRVHIRLCGPAVFIVRFRPLALPRRGLPLQFDNDHEAHLPARTREVVLQLARHVRQRHVVEDLPHHERQRMAQDTQGAVWLARQARGKRQRDRCPRVRNTCTRRAQTGYTPADPAATICMPGSSRYTVPWNARSFACSSASSSVSMRDMFSCAKVAQEMMSVLVARL